jgi:hypothetical protein
MFVRPSKVTDGSYVPFPIAEKDPIRKKYGIFTSVLPFRDQSTQLLSAKELLTRFDPNKNITFYFAPGMPPVYRDFFQSQVATATNKILTAAKAGGQLQFLNYNDATSYNDGQGPIREVGDPRYSFVIWHSDLDHDSGLLGVEQPFIDPRTGEVISSSVNVYEGPFKDSIQQRLDLFLKTVGLEYLTPDGEFDDNALITGTQMKAYPTPCTDGQVVPLAPTDVAQQFNRQSTVYGKMQAYLQKPFATYGYLGPADFLPKQDNDFFNAYFSVLPYQIYADPQANAFVTPAAGSFGTPAMAYQANWQALQNLAAFTKLAGDIDKGLAPFDSTGPSGIKDAVDFYRNWASLSQAVTDYQHTQFYAQKMRSADTDALFSYFDVYQKNGRHCVGGKWESRKDYLDHLITSLNMATAVHEFGHALGLAHNFMGSVDMRNFPQDANAPSCMQDSDCPTTTARPGSCDMTTKKCVMPLLYASSLMDYNQQISEAFFETTANTPVWPAYDAAALAFIYGNDLKATDVGPRPVPAGMSSTTISGQVSNTVPWTDPLGFDATGTTEKKFLYCSDVHTRYTPLCRRYDMGVTPSEIAANDLQQREWNYLWTNFRLYHKYFSAENYPVNVATSFNEMRRFSSLWAFDWSAGEITNTLRLIGTPYPANSTAADYYSQLTNKFNTDVSIANQLTATYHRAIIEQASGERPFITVYDPYFGDLTQQGIQLDKVTATSSFSQLWPAISNFDPSQAGGFYLTSFGSQFGDPSYNTVSESVLADYLGAAYATYTYSQVGPIANFAATTHSPAYNGDLKLRTWVGGWAFDRERDFLDFLHAIAAKYNFPNCDENGLNCHACTTIDDCTWDPRLLTAKASYVTQSDRYNRFQAPDGRTYIWGYIKSRNQWVLADKDRNNATYTLMLSWTTDLVNGEDSGYNGSEGLEYKVRYVVDAFTYYDGQSLAAP